MLLMMLSNLVVEKVLLVRKSLAATDVVQQKQGKRRRYDVSIMRNQFDRWLTSVVDRERVVTLVLIVEAVEVKLQCKQLHLPFNESTRRS